MIQQSFYANLGLYESLEAGILDKITDTPAITEITVGNLEMPISENISLNESGIGGGAIGGLNDYLIIYEEIDGRVRGALKTIFISDERYFNNVGTTGPRTRRGVFPWRPAVPRCIAGAINVRKNDYVGFLGTNFQVGTGAQTFLVWCKITGTNASIKDTILSCRTATTGFSFSHLGSFYVGFEDSVEVESYIGGGNIQAISSARINDGAWNLLGFIAEGGTSLKTIVNTTISSAVTGTYKHTTGENMFLNYTTSGGTGFDGLYGEAILLNGYAITSADLTAWFGAGILGTQAEAIFFQRWRESSVGTDALNEYHKGTFVGFGGQKIYAGAGDEYLPYRVRCVNYVQTVGTPASYLVYDTGTAYETATTYIGLE